MDDKIPHKRDCTDYFKISKEPPSLLRNTLQHHCWTGVWLPWRHASSYLALKCWFLPITQPGNNIQLPPSPCPQCTNNSEFPWDHGPKCMCELMIIWGQKKAQKHYVKWKQIPTMKSKTSEWVMSKDEVSSYWNQHTASVNRRFVCSPLLVKAQDFL